MTTTKHQSPKPYPFLLFLSSLVHLCHERQYTFAKSLYMPNKKEREGSFLTLPFQQLLFYHLPVTWWPVTFSFYTITLPATTSSPSPFFNFCSAVTSKLQRIRHKGNSNMHVAGWSKGYREDWRIGSQKKKRGTEESAGKSNRNSPPALPASYCS